MLRTFTQNSSVGTHATIPWLDRTAGGNESAISRIESASKGRLSLNLTHPLLSDQSDEFPDIHPAQIGSKQISSWPNSVYLVISGTGTNASKFGITGGSVS